MVIRRLEEKDIDAVMAIANHYIENSLYTWKWRSRPREVYLAWLEEHQDPYPAFIAEEKGDVMGYGSLGAFRSAEGWAKVCENSLYLKPDAHNKGYGRALMEKLISEAKRLGFWAITAWIDGNNTTSIAFHKKFGFYEIGVMKNVGNKAGKRLDCVILQLDIQ